VVERKAWFGTEGKTHVDEGVLVGVEHPPRLDFKPDDAVAAFPETDVLAGVPVRHAGLAEDRVLIDNVGVFALLEQRHGEKPLVDAAETSCHR
jgi:hypothetical protein